ncbi:DUF1198 domain-containing protein [Rouxiella badensis]|jgi:uncharacterized membrane protein|uniref:DUF1198 domain-containing protein n=1 Tax=Rouxiella badensis TaxID=1646377 RepID=A0A1X0WCV1_9GAMM|nr:DUF1198 domain-containing protein [Rouxiella badensis]MCC3702050.1 DUF1198 domain-containing protein [Rouxiella badensis]MCC3717044.1 DUF1198 domain-containing protein [Rouxiella badensis]MCC3728152.1 DUF1198 domain-containing protein [Rouxiella badensis]MCC3732056.1 DUF1198 domain-containing protein [Rouxiella badensis]MCC3739896.1 DUF1198 domain-containing protein [Rouxiella badensis]
MIWIMIAALVVVFVVGYWFMTADTRKANDSLASLLKIKPVYIDSMLLEMGKRQSAMFIRSISGGYAEEIRKAAYIVFIYHTFIKDASDENIAHWRNVLVRAHLDPVLTSEHAELALFYFSELDIEPFELAQFRRSYNETFNQLHLV